MDFWKLTVPTKGVVKVTNDKHVLFLAISEGDSVFSDDL